MDNLEEKVSWKQWLPLGFGPLFAIEDAVKGKPHIFDMNNKFRFYGSAIYHATVSAYPTYLGIMDILERGLF